MNDDTRQPTRLRIVTPNPEPNTPAAAGASPCPHDYTGWCDTCVAERERLVARGVRPRRSLTMRKAA